jgi:protocatechuate 4,5-dioxygenase beta chain
VAEIVAAMAMTHAPGLTGWFGAAAPADQAMVLSATAEMRRRLEAARADVVVMVSNDHLLNWPLTNVPEYTVGIGAEHAGPAEWFDEWLALARFRRPGHPELARWLVREGARRGLMLAFLPELQLDDGISVPVHYLLPDGRRRLVPVTMNCTVPPLPTAARAYQVGAVLRDALRAYPGPERIAIVATGGLSHEPGGPRYFWVDEAFDRWFLDLLRRGDHAAIVDQCTTERMEAAGSGGTAELLAWLVALAFTAGPAEVLGYAPAVPWRTGTGFVVWDVAPADRPGPAPA